jgi:threonine synthase
MREATLYGAEVVKVSGTYDETKDVAAAFAKRRGIHLDRGAKAVPGKESMKTLGFEIAEQLGLKLHPNEPGRFASPDWYVQAVSGGIGPLGVWKGFSELHQMGLIDKMPKLGIVQAAGCAPMVQALAAGVRRLMRPEFGITSRETPIAGSTGPTAPAITSFMSGNLTGMRPEISGFCWI